MRIAVGALGRACDGNGVGDWGTADVQPWNRTGSIPAPSGRSAPSSGLPKIPFDLRRAFALLKPEVLGLGGAIRFTTRDWRST
jgi:hypothetical protein